MTYPATSYPEGVDLTITAGNQLHEVINGTATDTVPTDSGDIPTVRKALADSMMFKPPIPWVQGEVTADPLETRLFNGQPYWAPTATLSSPVSLGPTPVGSDDWLLAPQGYRNDYNLGKYQPGILISDNLEYVVYNGDSYFADSPPYTTTTTTPDLDTNMFVGDYITLDKASDTFSNKNELSNSNFLTPSPDVITPPSATPEAYVAGTQVFSGVFAGPSGATITLIDGRVNCTAGDYQFKIPNTDGLERIPTFTSSVSDYNGIPKTTGVSHTLITDEYVVTVTPSAGDVFSVKLEQGGNATKHEVQTAKGNKYTYNNVSAMILSKPPVGSSVDWDGYYEAGDGGGNSGVVKSGSHIEDGGSIFSLGADLYVEADVNSGRLDVLKFGIKYGVGLTEYYDDRFVKALSSGVPLRLSGFVRLNTNIVPPLTVNIESIGANFAGLFWPDLSSGVLFNMSAGDYISAIIDKVNFVGGDTSTVTVLRCEKVKQASRISDIAVSGGDVGMETEESWTSCFDNLYIRQGGSFGYVLKSPQPEEQVNALTLDGVFVQGYQHNYAFDGTIGGGRSIYIPHGSSELSRKTSMIINGFGGVAFGPGFYFEANYTDATGSGTDILDKTKPVDILIKNDGGSSDAVYSFDKCFHAVRNDFNTPNEVVGAYIEASSANYTIEFNKNTHACNTTAYVDYDVYNDSSTAEVTLLKAQSNSKNRYRGLVVSRHTIASDLDVQTGFTSTWDGITKCVLSPGQGYHTLFHEITTGGTTTSSLAITIRNSRTNAVLQTINIPAGVYVAGERYIYSIVQQFVPVNLAISSPATGDNVSGFVYITKPTIGETGTFTDRDQSNFIFI